MIPLSAKFKMESFLYWRNSDCHISDLICYLEWDIFHLRRMKTVHHRWNWIHDHDSPKGRSRPLTRFPILFLLLLLHPMSPQANVFFFIPYPHGYMSAIKLRTKHEILNFHAIDTVFLEFSVLNQMIKFLSISETLVPKSTYKMVNRNTWCCVHVRFLQFAIERTELNMLNVAGKAAILKLASK